MKERVGIFGGCFDPITNLHLLTAEAARVNMLLDRVIFEPVAPGYMYNGKKPVVSFEHRAAMISEAISSNSKFEVGFAHSNMEYYTDGVVYTPTTYQLLTYYSKHLSDVELFYICGSDSLLTMCKWQNIHELFKEYSVIVVDRVGSEISNSLIYSDTFLSMYVDKIYRVQPYVSSNISSTNVRNMCRSGRSIRYMVPDVVYDYIIQHGFYKML